MAKIVPTLTIAVAFLIGVPATALLAYDFVEVRPRLSQIETLLDQANPEDASPPEIVRDLIDANVGSPTRHAARLILFRVYPRSSHSVWVWRNLLWSILLPMHFGESQVYGLYSSLSHNGSGYGLSEFASREYGLALSQLSPIQASTAVAALGAPTVYTRNRQRLDQRARLLLERLEHAP